MLQSVQILYPCKFEVCNGKIRSILGKLYDLEAFLLEGHLLHLSGYLQPMQGNQADRISSKSKDTDDLEKYQENLRS